MHAARPTLAWFRDDVPAAPGAAVVGAPGTRVGDGRYEVLLKAPPSKKKAKKDKLETVKLSLDGKEHDLIVGYVAETPVWRPSYRLVVSKGADGKSAPTADLQAWGIVQNLSGEDWTEVRLSLVTGAPVSPRLLAISATC